MHRPVHLVSLSVVAPPNELRQQDVLPAAVDHFTPHNASFGRLMKVYMNAAIDTRRSCVPLDWYKEEHTFGERNALYLSHGLDLIQEAAEKALAQAGMEPDEIDGVVAVSSSGIATPSLDALLIERLNLPRKTMRAPIFGLGCVGGVLGLARTADLAQAHPGSRWLVVVLELCGLTFRHNDYSKSNIVATALFADGAAAAILSSDGHGPIVTSSGEHTWPDSLGVMGWDVRNDGLAVVFSRDIPNLVRTQFGPVVDEFLSKNNLNRADIGSFVCHPGGIKVVEALEEVLDLEVGELTHSREVLKTFGNMSAVTVLFVLDRALQEKKPVRHLLSSLGPGFTAGFLVLDARNIP